MTHLSLIHLLLSWVGHSHVCSHSLQKQISKEWVSLGKESQLRGGLVVKSLALRFWFSTPKSGGSEPPVTPAPGVPGSLACKGVHIPLPHIHIINFHFYHGKSSCLLRLGPWQLFFLPFIQQSHYTLRCECPAHEIDLREGHLDCGRGRKIRMIFEAEQTGNQTPLKYLCRVPNVSVRL